ALVLVGAAVDIVVVAQLQLRWGQLGALAGQRRRGQAQEQEREQAERAGHGRVGGSGERHYRHSRGRLQPGCPTWRSCRFSLPNRRRYCDGLRDTWRLNSRLKKPASW